VIVDKSYDISRGLLQTPVCADANPADQDFPGLRPKPVSSSSFGGALTLIAVRATGTPSAINHAGVWNFIGYGTAST